MPNTTVRANARPMLTDPLTSVNAVLGHPEVPDDFILQSERGKDRSRFSPEFAVLDREFGEALAEESAAVLSDDGTAAGGARIALATEKALEVMSRIDATEVVYVKDLAVRDRAMLWEWLRHGYRIRAQIDAKIAAEKGERLQ
jgi:hypothetical protein